MKPTGCFALTASNCMSTRRSGWASVPSRRKKSTCGKCLVHCYQPQMRENVKKVMRYAGPRMLFHHPILALQHVMDESKKPEKLTTKHS